MSITNFLAGTIFVGTIAALSISDPTISGPARVIDGDTIVINNTHIRLWGIDAPERSQPLGREAAFFLYNTVKSNVVSCSERDHDRYGRTVAQCAVMGRDLGRLMVSNGMAIDYTRYSHGFYKDEEAAAKSRRLGVWSDPNFVKPEVWRQGHKTH